MNTSHKQLFVSVFCLSFSVLFLSGCAWWPFNKNASKETNSSACNSDVLMSIDGKPVLTVADYEEQLDMACKANPQVDMFLKMMPNAEKDYIFRSIAMSKLIKAWAEKQGIDQKESFQKERKQLHEAMDLQLYMKHFDEAYPVSISESDLAQYYEAKKDSIPGLMIAPGGVDVVFVRFDSKNKAENFFAKAKELKKLEAFKSFAEEQKYHLSNVVMNAKSQFSDSIKNVVLALNKFPSVHMIKAGDGAYLVLLATGKSEAQYHALSNPEVHQALKKMMADERKEKQLEQIIEKLKQEFNVVENDKYFANKEEQKRSAQQEQSLQSVQDSDENQTDNPVKV